MRCSCGKTCLRGARRRRRAEVILIRRVLAVVAAQTFKGPVAAGSDDATVGELSLKGLDMLRDIMWAKQPICLPHAEPASSGNNTVLAYKALWELCSILRQWRCRLSARLSREVADLQVPEVRSWDERGVIPAPDSLQRGLGMSSQVPADPAKPSTAQGNSSTSAPF